LDSQLLLRRLTGSLFLYDSLPPYRLSSSEWFKLTKRCYIAITGQMLLHNSFSTFIIHTETISSSVKWMIIILDSPSSWLKLFSTMCESRILLTSHRLLPSMCSLDNATHKATTSKNKISAFVCWLHNG